MNSRCPDVAKLMDDMEHARQVREAKLDLHKALTHHLDDMLFWGEDVVRVRVACLHRLLEAERG